MSKVVKFGGSSLADANQFRKVADIIRSDKERRYVVPSAPGKRFKDDIKVTDMLYACYDAVANEGKNAYNQFAPIAERFNGIISDLGLTLSLDDEYEVIIDNFRKDSDKYTQHQRPLGKGNNDSCRGQRASSAHNHGYCR